MTNRYAFTIEHRDVDADEWAAWCEGGEDDDTIESSGASDGRERVRVRAESLDEARRILIATLPAGSSIAD